MDLPKNTQQGVTELGSDHLAHGSLAASHQSNSVLSNMHQGPARVEMPQWELHAQLTGFGYGFENCHVSCISFNLSLGLCISPFL